MGTIDNLIFRTEIIEKLQILVNCLKITSIYLLFAYRIEA